MLLCYVLRRTLFHTWNNRAVQAVSIRARLSIVVIKQMFGPLVFSRKAFPFLKAMTKGAAIL
jgi:hypothetical protein